MKLKTNLVISGILLALQGIVQMEGVFPDEYRWVPVVAHLCVEYILKVKAAIHNPDGTPATEVYTPAKRK